MGRPTRPLHDAGTHGTFERRSLRQAARRGRLTTRPDLPETWSGPLLHHAEGHDPLDRGDFETVESLGHGMKGAGGSYGFQAITDIGAALEQAAESVDNDASRKWVGELSSYLDRVEGVSE